MFLILETEQNQLRLCRKYHKIIEKCEKLDFDKILLMEQLADNLKKNFVIILQKKSAIFPHNPYILFIDECFYIWYNRKNL